MTPTAADLAGRLRLFPGREPALHSSRRDWLPGLAAGRPAAALPALVGTLFSLCGHAHRWAAQAAAQAASGAATQVDDGARRAHRLSTLKDQWMRLAVDWPRTLPGAPQGDAMAALLRGSPLWRAGLDDAQRLQELPAWLAAQVLGQPLDTWLADVARDPVGQPWHWAAQGASPLAALLHSQRAACALATPTGTLDLLDHAPAAMAQLARLMTEPGFAMRPHWQGRVPDTGPWSRRAGALPCASAGERLAARVVEAMRLARPDGDEALAMGALGLAPGEGLAWVEMARGLLVHRVRLQDGADGPRLADARVLAPTEWNVHPQGHLAQALARLDPADADAAARLAVAFDPCVPFEIAPPGAEDNPAMPQRREEDPRCMN